MPATPIRNCMTASGYVSSSRLCVEPFVLTVIPPIPCRLAATVRSQRHNLLSWMPDLFPYTNSA